MAKPTKAKAVKTPAARKSAVRKTKPPVYRLDDPTEEAMTEAQRSLRDAIFAGPRGQRKKLNGPFAVWLQAPAFGQLAQALGAHCRYHTALDPRLSEFAILCIGRLWKSQYEWFAHEGHALKAGVKPQTIKSIKAGRLPAGAPKDERAIYEFVAELHKTRRVSDRTYKKVRAFLDEAAMVEFVGILGYYTLISMSLNVFHAPLPEGETLPFAEPR